MDPQLMKRRLVFDKMVAPLSENSIKQKQKC